MEAPPGLEPFHAFLKIRDTKGCWVRGAGLARQSSRRCGLASAGNISRVYPLPVGSPIGH